MNVEVNDGALHQKEDIEKLSLLNMEDEITTSIQLQ